MLAFLLALSAMTQEPTAAAAREAAIRLARETLASELGTEPGALELRAASATEWRDSSLGCPEKGKRHLPVLTPGHRVTLEHDGRSYVVHVGGGRAVRCDSGAPATAARDPRAEDVAAAARAFEAARRDLASRLGVAESEVKAGYLRRTTWPDASLGCPRPGEMYALALTPGFVIELEVAGARHVYHGDGRRVVSCPESAARP
jgi:hypothetical protein